MEKKEPDSKLGSIVEDIKPTSHSDRLEEGIWSQLPTKFSIMLWRVKWGYLTTFAKLQGWGRDTQTTCLLCNQEDETIRHMFFNSEFSRSILLAMTEQLGESFWKILNIPKPHTLQTDIRIGDLIEACQKFTHHSV